MHCSPSQFFYPFNFKIRINKQIEKNKNSVYPDFFQFFLSKKLFQEHYQSVNQFEL